jgi:16S rRNA (cytidine1402-2'-O)-methyltransferase
MATGRPHSLYLVPTPIGNLEDITLRALRLLAEAPLILAEDTRTARRLLDHHGIGGRLLSYTEHNHAGRVPHVLSALAEGDVLLLSEAGMPGINDPGQALVAAVVAAGMSVVGLPGPSAVPLAVAIAGFPVASFTYVGFLPGRSSERRHLFEENGWSGHALVAFESPHRLLASLRDLEAVLGARRLTICRELTKLFEEVFRGYAQDALIHFSRPRGEFTLVVEGAQQSPADEGGGASALASFLQERAALGTSGRDAVAAAVTRFGISRRQAYIAWQDRQRQQSDRD